MNKALNDFFTPVAPLNPTALTHTASMPQAVKNMFTEVKPLSSTDFTSSPHLHADENCSPHEPEFSIDNPQKPQKTADSNQQPKTAPPCLSLDNIAQNLAQQAELISIDGELFCFTGEFYRKIAKKDFLSFVQEVLDEALLHRIGSLRIIQEAYDWLIASPLIRHYTGEEVYTQNRFLIPFRNGIYDTKTGRFMAYSADIPVLFQIDANYRPGGTTPTPAWDSFTFTAFNGDKTEALRLLEVVGYLSMPCNDAKSFFVFGTAPDSGKSQFANFLVMLFGTDQVSRVSLHDLKGRFSLAQTAGKLVNFSMDLPAGVLKEEAVSNIKQATGERWIQVEEKYESPRSVFSSCRFVYGTNHALEISGSDQAFWNRVVLIPFLHSCPESQRNYNLAQDLYAERDSILTAAAQAAHELLKRGFVFTPSKTADILLKQWASAKDNISTFIETYCNVTHLKEDFIEVNELFYAFQQSDIFKPITLQYFSKEVRARYASEFSGNNCKKRIGNRTVNVVFGLRWKSAPRE